ncbi:glycoside hydrolase family 92 protein [Parabacteroides sp. AF18-52]|jgi:putative alpha-1,2-mannosidase|uniref:GH92 family glycosyl hydrolase n=1 Tax=Parabacteroides TaxID=375288 RepID=UPI000EFFA808|nr:GH92 family glycosyl hydrolase [Parabacteroides sp. AF18-52]RHR38035.1 glycoside hydrolase family 92 protein [Parabacteroides sp. AF18-52]
MNKLNKNGLFSLLLVTLLFSCQMEQSQSNNQYVNKFIGTGLNGCVTPVASVPFGMVQIGADTHANSSGYHYDHTSLVGFSHVHKSGGGCGDFLDILFLPLPLNYKTDSLTELYSQYYQADFSHEKEWAEPGYYSVDLYNGDLNVELTASLRCGLQRYKYKSAGSVPVIIDLEYGSQGACTIQREHDVDTVFSASFEKVDDYTVRGYRLTNGWAPEQHVYFYTTFSSPIKECRLFLDNECVEETSALKGRNVKAILTFENPEKILDVKTGISAVDMKGAEDNHRKEAADKDFDSLKKEAAESWTPVLGQIEVETNDLKKKELFYTSLHNVMMYPMLFSDVDNRFRGSDSQVHQTDGFAYYGAVIGLWDTFRAACPLIAVLRPDVMEDYIRTALEHFRYAGQLPIWTLAGVETYQMTGIHSMPLITNAYMNGVRNFDTELAMRAMVESAMKDTCGYSMGYFVGLENYKKYGYVPCDMEMESVARTLEYAFDDWAIARFASLTNHPDICKEFRARSLNYKNVIDPVTLLARGKTKDGLWRTPFYPLRSEHRSDDYCEGNAWQWTFFVPHDIDGLAKLMRGKEVLASRLDSLFTMDSSLEGETVSGDISGLIGQYAHGNEPGHHTIYMYNEVGQPHKTQKYVNEVLTTLYDTTPTGICGNEDTGQMSAWYVFSSLGFYPMDPVSGRYELGAPLFDRAVINLSSGKQFVITAENLSDKNIYVEKVWLNDRSLDRTYITFDELLNGGTLRFKMTDKVGL